MAVLIDIGGQGRGDGGEGQRSLAGGSPKKGCKVRVSPLKKLVSSAANAATVRVGVGLKMLIVRRGFDLGSRPR